MMTPTINLDRAGITAALKAAWKEGRVAVQNPDVVREHGRACLYSYGDGIGCVIGVCLSDEVLAHLVNTPSGTVILPAGFLPDIKDSVNDMRQPVTLNAVGIVMLRGDGILSFTTEEDYQWAAELQDLHDQYIFAPEKFIEGARELGVDLEEKDNG